MRKIRLLAFARQNATTKYVHNYNTLSKSPARLSIVEEVAGFDISVNDVVRVNVAKGREQSPHVALDLGRCHQVQEILPGDTAIEKERREGERDRESMGISLNKQKLMYNILTPSHI